MLLTKMIRFPLLRFECHAPYNFLKKQVCRVGGLTSLTKKIYSPCECLTLSHHAIFIKLTGQLDKNQNFSDWGGGDKDSYDQLMSHFSIFDQLA